MVGPSLEIEVQFLGGPGTGAKTGKALSVLKYEGRNLVLADAEKQLRSGTLVNVRDAATHQPEFRVLKLRQVKGERQLAFEPWFDGVAVGGDDIHGVGAGEG